MPFDILMGDSITREVLERRDNIRIEEERWKSEISEFEKKFKEIARYRNN